MKVVDSVGLFIETIYYDQKYRWRMWKQGRETKKKHNTSEHYKGALKPGDLYEGCPRQPCVATLVDYTNDELEGYSLTTGQPTNCSLKHCAPVKMTPEEVAAIINCKHDLDIFGYCSHCEHRIENRYPSEEERAVHKEAHPELY